ncbi:MAG: hypothetical protein WC501_01445 [Candidatus Micrarchaeia archaeon]
MEILEKKIMYKINGKYTYDQYVGKRFDFSGFLVGLGLFLLGVYWFGKEMGWLEFLSNLPKCNYPK